MTNLNVRYHYLYYPAQCKEEQNKVKKNDVLFWPRNATLHKDPSGYVIILGKGQG